MYFVYLLRSKKDNHFYIGQTNNISKRFSEHNSGKNLSTKHRKPFVLIGYETYITQKEARWREYQLKHHSDKKRVFIENLLKDKKTSK